MVNVAIMIRSVNFLLSLEHVWRRRIVLILLMLYERAERNLLFLLASWQVVDLVCEANLEAIKFLN